MINYFKKVEIVRRDKKVMLFIRDIKFIGSQKVNRQKEKSDLEGSKRIDFVIIQVEDDVYGQDSSGGVEKDYCREEQNLYFNCLGGEG